MDRRGRVVVRVEESPKAGSSRRADLEVHTCLSVVPALGSTTSTVLDRAFLDVDRGERLS